MMAREKILLAFLWIGLLALVLEVNNYIFNMVYLPLLEINGGDFEVGSKILDVFLLGFSFFLYALAGFLLACRVKFLQLSIGLAVSLAVIGLALEGSLSMHWFQIMPSHPRRYDLLVAFLGGITPAVSSIFGCYIYYLFKKEEISK